MNQLVHHDADIDLTEDNTSSNIILLQANNTRARYVLSNVINAHWTSKCLGIDKRSLPSLLDWLEGQGATIERAGSKITAIRRKTALENVGGIHPASS